MIWISAAGGPGEVSAALALAGRQSETGSAPGGEETTRRQTARLTVCRRVSFTLLLGHARTNMILRL